MGQGAGPSRRWPRRSFPALAGDRAACASPAAAAGVRYQGRTDVMLAVWRPARRSPGSSPARRRARPRCSTARPRLGGDSAAGAAILVNSGNSNAFTGQRGEASVAAICAGGGRSRGGVPRDTRLHRLDRGDRRAAAARADHREDSASWPRRWPTDGIEAAARAIMTTDTFAKGAVGQVEIDGRSRCAIAGHRQGLGHDRARHGDDAGLHLHRCGDGAARAAGACSPELTERTFNCITVDSDTSTSDTLLLGATGAAGVDATGRRRRSRDALRGVMLDLAHQVVRDGEGATKFVEIRVTGAASDARRPDPRAVDRQLAAGQDRHRRRGPELGPHRHGGRQVRRRGRPRPAVASASAISWWPRTAGSARLPRGRRRRLHEGPASS